MNEVLNKENVEKYNNIEYYNNLIKSVEKDLIKIINRKLEDETYAKDVLQNVYFKAYSKLNTIRDKSKFKSWILTIAKNECINMNKHIKRRREVSINRYEEVLEDTNNSIDSELIFDDIISNLSDEEKKLLKMKFQENYSNFEIANELKIPYNTVKSKINRAIKKITLILLVLILFSGFTVLATFVIKKIRAFFTQSTEAINTAVDNNYVQELNSDFVYDNDIGIKIDAIILDDKNLDISFTYDIKNKEDYGNIVGIRVDDYVISCDDEVLVDTNELLKGSIADTVKQSSYGIKEIETGYINSILTSTMKEDFPNLNKIFIKINKIHMTNSNNEDFTITGNWSLAHNVSQKFNERENISYHLVEENPLIKSYTANLYDTFMEFNIEFVKNIDFKEYRRLHPFLYTENEKISWIDCNFSEKDYKLKVTFDIGKYNIDKDNLKLEIPLTDENQIILEFRRDL